MFTSTMSQIGVVAMAIVCLGAAVFGRWPERVVAGALFVAWIASAAVEVRLPWHHPQLGITAIDIVYGAVVVAVCLRSRRNWLLAVAAFQVMVVVTEIALLIDARVNQWEFFSAYYVWSYLQLVAMAVGVCAEGRRPAGEHQAA